MTHDEQISWADLDELFNECRLMAQGLLMHEACASIQSTELVLTAMRRLRRPDQDWDEVHWSNRKYFFGALYRSMQRALVDHARKRQAQKRANEVRIDPEKFAQLLERHDVLASLDRNPEIIETLMGSLEELRAAEPDWVAVIEHRFFGGLTLVETAQMMDVSEKTIRRWWQRARIVLYDNIKTQLEA